jgi:hypothetical protein
MKKAPDLTVRGRGQRMLSHGARRRVRLIAVVALLLKRSDRGDELIPQGGHPSSPRLHAAPVGTALPQ